MKNFRFVSIVLALTFTLGACAPATQVATLAPETAVTETATAQPDYSGKIGSP